MTSAPPAGEDGLAAHSNVVLSVVDQSPLRRGGTAAQALRESVELAQVAERSGYSRYWVAEHHNIGSFAGTSPEILVGQIAARTSSIRVGSGGVMLSHYSALKVAEQFSILNSFYPGRIDLGIGRAPGSDQLTAQALSDPRPKADVQAFPAQVIDLLGYLHGFRGPAHAFAAIRPQPGPDTEAKPVVWLLGSSEYSARLAALLGLPFSFAEFFGITGGTGPMVAEMYRREFQPSQFLSEPKVNVTIQVTCAPTAEEATFIASSRELMVADYFLKLGLGPGMMPPEEAAAYPLTVEQRRYIERFSRGHIDGDPEKVRRGMLQAAQEFGTSDIGVVTNCYRFEDRVRSYQLVAKAFGIESAFPSPSRHLSQAQ
ncbi:MAG: LLM class flavin-dependent oxidoreductase [Dehalococcoidia bacterium]|nr:LLM class flavin-dependent oxidoreductase [Dehalococcoidia bacterium]